MRQATIDKAARFVDKGCVRKLPGIGGGASLWQVRALDGGEGYMVAVRGGQAACGCTAGLHKVKCSHGLAALYKAQRLPSQRK